MNKRDLIAKISAKTDQPASAVAEVVDELLRTVTTSVARGEKVVLSGFGTFFRRTRARRVARNIWAGEALPLPPANVPDFRPGKPFKELVARRRPRGGAKPRSPRR